MREYCHHMRTFPITGRIKRFASVFRDNGYSLFVVGGAVRDFLLGLGNSDLDFTTDARPEEVIALFRTVIPTGIAHGTVTVIFEGEHYEVTTFRSEGEYKDGRRPSSVTFIPSLEEDLKRRDFTINAFAASAITGKIVDNHNGEQDLKDGIIRAIGNPYERFDEDALRIMRAARISGKLNFTIEDQTFNAMGALKENLRLVSVERLHDELVHLVKSDHPRKGFEYLHASGALAVILPELAQGDGVLQKGFHHEDVLQHSLTTCQKAADLGASVYVRLAALFHDIGKATTREPNGDRYSFYNHEIVGEALTKTILRRLKASNEEIDTVSHLVRHHMFSYTPEMTDSAVRRFIVRVGIEHIEDLFKLRIADQMAISGRADTDLLDEFSKRINGIISSDDALSIKDLAIGGNDLLALGIPKGKRIGQTLQYLLETVLDDPAQNTKEQLFRIALAYQELCGFTSD